MSYIESNDVVYAIDVEVVKQCFAFAAIDFNMSFGIHYIFSHISVVELGYIVFISKFLYVFRQIFFLYK